MRLEVIDRPEHMLERARVYADVAEKALAIGKVHDAERLVHRSVADVEALTLLATTAEELATLARMRKLLEPVLTRLEAATQKPWTRCLVAGAGRRFEA